MQIEQEPEIFAEQRQSSPEVSLSELLQVLWRKKVTIVRAVIATATITTAVAFLLPVEYTAEAVILTPQKTQPSFSAMAQLTGLGSEGGLSSLGLLAGLGLRSPSDLYVGILESRTIADFLITKFKLKQVYDVDNFYSARKYLRRRTTIKAGRDTLIHVRV
ncbi:MAG: Wzz/FepE/Etk N-terminal domain-containing protein [Bryobacteraceae bacterium]